MSEIEIHEKNISEIELHDKNMSEIELHDKNMSEIELNDKNMNEIEIHDKNMSEIELHDKNMSEIESETSSRAYSPSESFKEKWIPNFESVKVRSDLEPTDNEADKSVERSMVSPHSDSEQDESGNDDSVAEKKYSGMQSYKVNNDKNEEEMEAKTLKESRLIEDEGEDNLKISEKKKPVESHTKDEANIRTGTDKYIDEIDILDEEEEWKSFKERNQEQSNRSHKAKKETFKAIREIDSSYSISPTLTEHTDQLASLKGTAVSTPIHSVSKRSLLTSPLITPVPIRSKNTGRLSPTALSSPQSVSIGNQPKTLTRFNEPLKQRRGKHFVDYKIPDPTVVYVPHKRQTHGQWTNVTVERKSNGRYVVIEQRPVHTRFTDEKFGSKSNIGQDLFSDQYKLSIKKTPWSYSTKGSYIERQSSKGFYEPYLPPIKPKYGAVESKVGSLDNYSYIPGGGEHKIPTFKVKWEAESRVGSLPTTGRLDASPLSHAHTERNSLKLPEISPRYGASADSGAFSSIHYTPGGSVYIRKNKNNAKSRIGSLDNASYRSQGGDIELPKNKVNWKTSSKVGSLDNVTHLPKSSNIQVFSEKLDWQANSKIGSWDNASHKPQKKRFRVPHFNANWEKTSSRVGSLGNIDYQPGGGHSQIINEKVSWKGRSKIDNHWKFNFDYKGLFDNDFDSDSDSEFQEQTYNTVSGTV